MADSIRDLWQLISGKAVILPDELISTELNANKAKLQLCLNYFKPLSSSAKVENIGKKLTELHTNFVLKLAQYLDLNEKQSYAIYQLYLLRSSMINQKDVHEILSSEKCSASLMEKIGDFYRSERTYLLRCVKHILSNCEDPSRPHNEVFKDFTRKLLEGNGFIGEIKKQYSLICNKVSELHNLSQQELKGFFHVVEKSRQNALLTTSLQRERCEILELLLLTYKYSEISYQDLYDFFEIFKKHGFIGGQNISNVNDQSLNDRICFLQTLVLVGGFDLETLVSKSSEPSSNENQGNLMNDEQYELFNNSINGIGDLRCLSPFFLTWTIIRHMRKDASFSKLGNKSLRLEVFRYLDEILRDLKLHHVDHSMEYLIYTILYGMLNSVLSVFHESTLGDTNSLYKVLNKLLENPHIADSFLALKREEGVRSLLSLSLEMFPVQFERPMEMMISLVKSGVTGLRESLHELKNLASFTDAIDHPASLIKVGSEGWYKLVHSRKPALYPGGKMTIFEGTFGKIFNDPVIDGTKVAGDFITYVQSCNGVEFLVSEVVNLIHESQFCSPESITRVSMVMRLVGEGLRTDGSLMKESVLLLRELVEGAVGVMHKFSTIPYPPIHLLGSCVSLLQYAMEIFPEDVWRGIQSSGFLPHFSYHVKNLNEARRALNSGSYGHILMGREKVEGLYPVTEAFLDLVHQCIDFPSIRESTIGMTAPVLLICQEIFTSYDKWKYSPGFSSERIGLLCLKIFQKVLSRDEQSLSSPSVSMATRTTDHLMDSLSPKSAVVNSMLFTEAGGSLLGLAHTGNEEIEVKLAEQNSAFIGHGSSLIGIIKGSLAVLNHLLTKHPTVATTSPYLSRALSTTPGTSVASTFNPPELFCKQTQTPHLIKSIVMYVDNRHDCELNIQAVKLIKNIAQTFPISMLACLGSDVYDIKEIYLDRLQALTDDVNLKVAILDWLTTCIQSQPGLVEIFINDDKNKLSGLNNEPITNLFSDAKTSKPSVSTESKCLDTIARLIKEEKQGTYECPPELMCASFELIHSLWKEYQMSSMSYLKKLNTFWNSLFCVMKESNLKKYANSGSTYDIPIKCISHIIRVIALEVFYNERNGDESLNFVDKMNCVVEGDGIKNWSEFVHKRLMMIVSSNDKYKSDSELLLLAWRDLMVVLASLKKKDSMSSIREIQDRKDSILVDLLKVLKVTLTSSSSIDLKISNILSSLIVILVNRWNRSIEHPRELVESSCDTLEVLLSSSVIHKCDSLLLSIVSSLVIIFKKCKAQLNPDANKMEHIRRLMDIVCRLLQSSVLYRDGHEYVSDDDGRKRMKMFQTSAKLKLLPISAIHLLTEILSLFPNSLSAQNPSPNTSFSVVPPFSPIRGVPPSPPTLVRVSPPSTDFIFDLLGHYSIVQCLISWVTYGLMSMNDLDLVQAIFTYFIKLVQTEKGAEMLFANGVNDQLGIYIHPLYFIGSQMGSSQEPTLSIAENEDRINIYLLYTHLTCQMLVTLRAFYLDKALEHLAMNKDRFHSVLESFALSLFSLEGSNPKVKKGGKREEAADSTNKSPFNRAARKCSEENKFGANMRLYEMEIVVQFINELSKFGKEWKTRSPELLQSIMMRVCVWTQKSAGLLRLPRFMQSMIDGQRSGHSTTESSSQSKHIFTYEDSNTLELLKIQQKILHLISINLSTMKRFSASLVDMIYQRLDDLSPPDSFVLIDFSTPSIDEDSMPTFGMLISVFNFCIELLSKVEGSRSLSPHKPSTPRVLVPASSLNKSLVMFTMDQILYLMMTHASQSLKDKRVSPQEKQILKSYLNNELSSCLNIVHRHFRTSSPSPVSSRRSSSVGVSAPLKFNREHQFFGLADIFTKKILR